MKITEEGVIYFIVAFAVLLIGYSEYTDGMKCHTELYEQDAKMAIRLVSLEGKINK